MTIKDLVPTEEEECMAFYEWVCHNPRLKKACHHTPNGGTRTKKEVTDKFGNIKVISLEAKRLKRLGVKPGVFDYFFKMANKHFHGLYIEMKRVKFSTISQAQKDFQVECIDEGYAAHFCYGAEHAIRVVQGYLNDMPPIKAL